MGTGAWGGGSGWDPLSDPRAWVSAGQGSLPGLFTIIPWLWDRRLSPSRAEVQR